MRASWEGCFEGSADRRRGTMSASIGRFRVFPAELVGGQAAFEHSTDPEVGGDPGQSVGEACAPNSEAVAARQRGELDLHPGPLR